MLRTITNLREGARAAHGVHRPTALTLARHIISAPFSDGMAWIVLPVLALTVFLYNNHFQNDMLLALMFIGLGIIALVRGCRNWQSDLDEYQRHLTYVRKLKQGRNSSEIPGYHPSR